MFDYSSNAFGFYRKNTALCRSIAHDLIDDHGVFVKQNCLRHLKVIDCNYADGVVGLEVRSARHIQMVLESLMEGCLLHVLDRFSVVNDHEIRKAVLMSIGVCDKSKEVCLADVKRSALFSLLWFFNPKMFGDNPVSVFSAIIQKRTYGMFLEDILMLFTSKKITRNINGNEIFANFVDFEFRLDYLNIKRPIEEFFDSNNGLMLILLGYMISDCESMILSLAKKIIDVCKSNDLFFLSFEDFIEIAILVDNNIKYKDFLHKKNSFVGGLKAFCAKQEDRSFYDFQFILDIKKTVITKFVVDHDNYIVRCWFNSLCSLLVPGSCVCKKSMISILGLGDLHQDGIAKKTLETLQNVISDLEVKVGLANQRIDTLDEVLSSLDFQLKRSTQNMSTWIKMEMGSVSMEKSKVEQTKHDLMLYIKDAQNIFHSLLKSMVDCLEDGFCFTYKNIHQNKFCGQCLCFCLSTKKNKTTWKTVSCSRDLIAGVCSFVRSVVDKHLLSSVSSFVRDCLNSFVLEMERYIGSYSFVINCCDRARCFWENTSVSPDDGDDGIWSLSMFLDLEKIYQKVVPDSYTKNTLYNWFDNPKDLWAFLIDVVLRCPTDMFKKCESMMDVPLMLITPEFPCLFVPSKVVFFESCTSDVYHHSWIRDRFIDPAVAFYSSLKIPVEHQMFLLDCIGCSDCGHCEDDCSVFSFREFVVSKNKGLERESDSVLFTHLPLFSSVEFSRRALYVFDGVSWCNKSNIINLLNVEKCLFSAKDVFACVMSALSSSENIDLNCWHSRFNDLIARFVSVGLLAPRPATFVVDSCSVGCMGFVCNPGNGKLELWSVDEFSPFGVPLENNNKWFSVDDKKQIWRVIFP